MEQLFCLVAPKAPEAVEKKGEANTKQSNNKASEINLLDGKRSLNINIFLKQFRRYTKIKISGLTYVIDLALTRTLLKWSSMVISMSLSLKS